MAVEQLLNILLNKNNQENKIDVTTKKTNDENKEEKIDDTKDIKKDENN